MSLLWLMTCLRLRWSMYWFGEGKKLSTEDIFLLYLGTIAGELKEMRTEMARLEDKIDKTLTTIDEINRRIDTLQAILQTYRSYY